MTSSFAGLSDSILNGVVSDFQHWLHLPDPGGLVVLLGTVVANLLSGDPVWLLLIGPPSSGKNELLYSIGGLPYNVHSISTITSEGALLSGSSASSRRVDAKGGLLREIGGFGFLVLKDFTSIISMHREKRGELLAALREIHDGRWTRRTGVDGGQVLRWDGKLAVIGGCTEAIDSAHAVTSGMGERFVLFRLPPTDGQRQARHVLRQRRGDEARMRRELADSVNTLFSVIGECKPPSLLARGDQDCLAAIANLGARCRSAVDRHPYSREIESVPEPEAPGRLARCLSQLLAGFGILEVPSQVARRLLLKIALDSMPAVRRKVFDCLSGLAGKTETDVIADLVKLPKTTTVRALEDLWVLGVAERTGDGKTRLYWSLSSWSRNELAICDGLPEPEMSEVECSPA